MKKVESSNYRIHCIYSNISTNERFDYYYGYVVTKHGIVRVYSQGNILGGDTALTHIGIVKDGRMYDRRFRKRFTKRGLAVVAGRLAREVFGE